jgi:hypothetical protein
MMRTEFAVRNIHTGYIWEQGQRATDREFVDRALTLIAGRPEDERGLEVVERQITDWKTAAPVINLPPVADLRERLVRRFAKYLPGEDEFANAIALLDALGTLGEDSVLLVRLLARLVEDDAAFTEMLGVLADYETALASA